MLCPGKPRIAFDAELRFHSVALERQTGLFETTCQFVHKIAKRLLQLLLEKILVLNEPFAILVKIQSFQKRIAFSPNPLNGAIILLRPM